MAQPRETESGGMDTINDWSIRRYTPADAPLWNERVDNARNATFLFRREYMDYHADRFADCSLIALRRGKIAAILPADLTTDGTLRSHGGLTYGGWILPCGHVDGTDMMNLFDAWTAWCRDNGIARIDYRPLPPVYHRQPAQEDIYALFRHNAVLASCSLSSTIDYASWPGFNTMQRRHLRKAAALHPVITEICDVASFHAMLTDCLDQRHNTAPVHSVSELQLLRDRFPDAIRIFGLHLDSQLMAGVCMYLTGTVAHAQYIATTPEGRRLNMLTPLFHHLINLFAPTHRYFDFGISCEDSGRILNGGLLRQKSSFGASGTVYQRFIMDL